ncbi:VOC family protein [Nocardioides coralli]|uniref:VOC family protein n=1 Tax=Nocardioides coralli TaxID=2872154 RepID=UPI001CA457A2|nr:VOC family protein [Nocardioides coralli]QZY28205.1 hypothetical protein K6T13_12015 [Nocardioides coralli]
MSGLTPYLCVGDARAAIAWYVDAVAAAVEAAGITLDRGPEDTGPAGRVAVFRDPFGHRWFLDQSPG